MKKKKFPNVCDPMPLVVILGIICCVVCLFCKSVVHPEITLDLNAFVVIRKIR